MSEVTRGATVRYTGHLEQHKGKEMKVLYAHPTGAFSLQFGTSMHDTLHNVSAESFTVIEGGYDG